MGFVAMVWEALWSAMLPVLKTINLCVCVNAKAQRWAMFLQPSFGRWRCLFVCLNQYYTAALAVCPRLSISFPLVNQYSQQPRVPFAVEELELKKVVSPEPPAWRGGSWVIPEAVVLPLPSLSGA